MEQVKAVPRAAKKPLKDNTEELLGARQTSKEVFAGDQEQLQLAIQALDMQKCELEQKPAAQHMSQANYEACVAEKDQLEANTVAGKTERSLSRQSIDVAQHQAEADVMPRYAVPAMARGLLAGYHCWTGRLLF